MAFDAGAIVAHLDLDDAEFDRKLRADVARIEAFEKSSGSRAISADLDPAAIARARRQFSVLDQQLTRDAQQRMSGGQGSVLGTLMGFTSRRALPGAPAPRESAIGRDVASLVGGGGGGGGGGGSAGRGGFGGFINNVLGGAGPGIGQLGLGTRVAGIAGLAGIGLGALPAVAGVGAVAGTAGLGAGVLALGARQLIGTKQQPGQLYDPAQALLKQMKETFTKGAQPLVAPLRRAFAELGGPGGIIANLQRPLQQLFAGAATLIQPLVHGLTDLVRMILPGLGAAFRAVAPSVQPLLDGVGGLVRGLLPGLVTLLRAAHPLIVVFAGILGTLGTDLGKMLSDFAPVLGQSAIILKALFDVVSGLLPVIGQLAAIFARALAPVITQFAGVIKALMPTLIIIGKVIADLAKAVVGDLAAAFGAVAKIIVAISPALAAFAAAFSQVFTVLENSGVFGIIAAALESIATPLATMISLILKGLTPLLPPLIKFIGQVSAILAQGLAAAIVALLPPLTQLAMVVIQALVETLPILLPLFAGLVALLTPVIVRVVQDLAIALSAMIKAIPPPVLRDIALGFLAIWAAIKIGGLIAAVSNPVTLIVIAVGLLIVGIVELATHWHEVWTNIKNWADDAWKFLTSGWGQFLIPGLTLIRLAVDFLSQHWHQMWTDVKNWALDAWHFLGRVWTDITLVFQIATDTIKLILLGVAITALRVVDDIVSAFALLPGPLGAPFRRAKADIDQTLAGMQRSAASATAQIQADFDKLHGKTVSLLIAGSGTWKALSAAGQFAGGGFQAGQNPAKHGGARWGTVVPGYGGGDRHPYLLEGGEAVLSKETTAAHAPTLAAWGVPGMQAGGIIPRYGGSIPGIGPWMQHNADVTEAGIINATGEQWTRQWQQALASMIGASGNAIVSFARSFLGRIPYVWGGTSLSSAGADCSGFVQAVYEHFGYNPPRTSEAQGGWVRRAPPTPGGLAFYNSPAGGPPPGHVAIVQDANWTVSQGGGMGPQMMPLHALPLMWTGVPPAGFGGGGGTGGQAGPGSVRGWLLEAMNDTGAPMSWLAPLMKIQSLETDNLANMTTVVNPNGGATGLMQVKPGTFAAYATVPGGITSPVANAVAGIRHIMASWGSPFNIPGIGLPGFYNGYDGGGWLMPGMTVAMNNTGMPEAVLDPQASQALLAGHGAGGGRLAGVINIMLPEGATVAQALSELTFALRVADQQALAGAGMRPGG